MTSIGAKIASGAALMLAFKVLERLIGVASMFVLARLLAPADFGLVAIATAIYALLELLGAFGLDVILIRDHAPPRSKYDTAWTINLFFYLLCGIVLVVAAPLAAHFFSEPRLIGVLQLLALAAVFQGVENIGVIAFRRDLAFSKDFTLMIGKRLITTVVVIVLAFVLRSHLALVIGIVIGRALGSLLSFLMHPYRPRLSLAHWREMIGVSGWLLLNNYLSFLIDHGPRILLGKIAGPHIVGIYTLAQEVSQMAINEFVAAINRAALPGYARISGGDEQFRRELARVLSAIGLIVFPASVGLACVADAAIPVLLGPSWVDAIPVLQILTFAAMLRALQSNLGAAYLVRGRPQRLTALLSMHALVVSIAIALLFARFGAISVAVGHLIAATLVLPLNFSMLRSEIRFTMAMGLRALWRGAAAAAVMAVVLMAWRHGATLNAHLSVMLMIDIALGAFVYVTAVYALWWVAGRPDGAERLLLNKLRERGVMLRG